MSKKKTTQQNTATVQDGHLILSLPQANNPVLWRKDLNEIGSATFEINDNKDDYALVLKKKKGTSEKISTFNDKDSALDALNLASNALLHGETVANQNAVPTTGLKKKKGFPKWAIILLILVGLFLLYSYMSAQMPNYVQMGDNAPAPQPNSNAAPTAPQTGVPLSADDFLNGM